MAMGSASMICLPFSGFDLESEPASNSKVFTSSTNDCFENQSIMLFQGLLWKSHHFPVYLFVFPLSFFAFFLDCLSEGFPSFLYPFF
jgi:hypothetical protein